MDTELATFGGGCFWCVEAVFQRLKGVIAVESGYEGGTIPNPSYEAVCTGRTGHAEVIQIYFDPSIISYAQLLKVFFSTHDPTTLNQQGADRGTQYRSVIFYHSPQQRQLATETVAALSECHAFERPIVTEVAPAEPFYPAEAYHQNYFNTNPENGYCRFVVREKVEKFEKAFVDFLKPD